LLNVGNIEVSDEELLEANISGVGNIYFKGSPLVNKVENLTSKAMGKE